jgi:hypothetical protein
MAYKLWNIASILVYAAPFRLQSLTDKLLFLHQGVDMERIDIHLHPLMTNEVQRYFASGLVALRSDKLNQDFLFLKLDASRSASAEWKSPFMPLLAPVEEDIAHTRADIQQPYCGLTASTTCFGR